MLFEPGLGNVSTTFALLALPVLLLRSLSGRQHNLMWCFGSVADAERRSLAMNVAAAAAGCAQFLLTLLTFCSRLLTLAAYCFVLSLGRWCSTSSR